MPGRQAGAIAGGGGAAAEPAPLVALKHAVASAVLFGALAACAGGGGGGGGASREESRVSSRSIQEVLAAHTDSLMAVPGVVGTALGLCDGAPCIKVFVADAAAAARAQLPDRLEGYPVKVEVTGIMRSRPPD